MKQWLFKIRVLNSSFCRKFEISNFRKFVFCHNSEIRIICTSEFAKFEYRILKKLPYFYRTDFPSKILQLTNLISQETLSMNLIIIFCIFFPRDLKWISYDFLYFFVVILTSVSSLLSQKDKAWFCLNSKIFKKNLLFGNFFS